MSTRSELVPRCSLALAVVCLTSWTFAGDYPIVDTGQERCYDNWREIVYPKSGKVFFGQDAQYLGSQPAYRDNGDGTATDRVTGLMWQKDPGPKKTYRDAVAGAFTSRVGGHDDWRLPTIKELYSLILFNGMDPDTRSESSSDLHPFIDADHFVCFTMVTRQRVIVSSIRNTRPRPSTSARPCAETRRCSAWISRTVVSRGIPSATPVVRADERRPIASCTSAATPNTARVNSTTTATARSRIGRPA